MLYLEYALQKLFLFFAERQRVERQRTLAIDRMLDKVYRLEEEPKLWDAKRIAIADGRMRPVLAKCCWKPMN